MKETKGDTIELRIRSPRTPRRDSVLEVCETMAAERHQTLAKFIVEVLAFHPYLVHRIQEARGEFKMKRPPAILKKAKP